jgi:aspartyl protease family protein
MIFAAIAIIAGLLVPRLAAQMQAARPAPSMMAARPTTTTEPAAANSRSVIVPPDAQGHFRVEGSVDGRRLEFMVDTGASTIALTADDAASLGIHPAQQEFSILLRTANGTVRAAPVRLGMVEIGDLLLHDVAAVVLPGAALSENLLGLSFLSRLRHFEYSEGKMVLEQ